VVLTLWLSITPAVGLASRPAASRAGVVGIYQRHDWADEKRAALEAWERYVREIVRTPSF
jgi:hypothetical protein